MSHLWVALPCPSQHAHGVEEMMDMTSAITSSRGLVGCLQEDV